MKNQTGSFSTLYRVKESHGLTMHFQRVAAEAYPIISDSSKFAQSLNVFRIGRQIALLVWIGLEIVQLFDGPLVVFVNLSSDIGIRLGGTNPRDPKIVALSLSVVIGLASEVQFGIYISNVAKTIVAGGSEGIGVMGRG